MMKKCQDVKITSIIGTMLICAGEFLVHLVDARIRPFPFIATTVRPFLW